MISQFYGRRRSCDEFAMSNVSMLQFEVVRGISALLIAAAIILACIVATSRQ